MEFDLPKEQSSIIKVIGVGGGGSNAVNHMFEKGIHGVNFVICNTDAQALENSGVPNKIQLGPECTEGLGAGSDPNIGRMATEESLQEIKTVLEKNTKMVFVTSGMGGGTGTGGAPVVAKLAKDMGLLTVAIVTSPFFFEGNRKIRQAKKGIEELRQNVDSIIVISNDKIRDIYGNLSQSEAFGRVDDILAIAAKSISEIITFSGSINVDFADVQYVMKNSGTAIMGSYQADGEDRALEAIKGALESPLLDENNIEGAEKILLNITSGTVEAKIDEIHEINNYILEHTGEGTDVIFGIATDEDLGKGLSVTVIATGFSNEEAHDKIVSRESKKVHSLEDQPKTESRRESSSDVFTPGVSQDQIRESSAPKQDPEIRRHTLFDQDEEEEKTETSNKIEFNFGPVEQDFSDDYSREEESSDAREESKQEDEEQKSGENSHNEEDQQSSDDDFFVIKKKNPSDQSSRREEENEALKDIERMREMKNLRKHYNDPNKLRDMEDMPAWQRNNIQFHNPPASNEQEISRYNLSDEEDGQRPQIRRNNSFLHDKAD